MCSIVVWTFYCLELLLSELLFSPRHCAQLVHVAACVVYPLEYSILQISLEVSKMQLRQYIARTIRSCTLSQSSSICSICPYYSFSSRFSKAFVPFYQIAKILAGSFTALSRLFILEHIYSSHVLLLTIRPSSRSWPFHHPLIFAIFRHSMFPRFLPCERLSQLLSMLGKRKAHQVPSVLAYPT